MSVINDIYNKYKNKCLTIPGFVVGQKEDVPYDITELANKYCGGDRFPKVITEPSPDH